MRYSYGPGRWLALAHEGAGALVHPDIPPARVERVWGAMIAGAPMPAWVGEFTGTAGPYALVHLGVDGVRVLLHGAVSALVGGVRLSGRDGAPWAEHIGLGVFEAHVWAEGATVERTYPLTGGVVFAQTLSVSDPQGTHGGVRVAGATIAQILGVQPELTAAPTPPPVPLVAPASSSRAPEPASQSAQSPQSVQSVQSAHSAQSVQSVTSSQSAAAPEQEALDQIDDIDELERTILGRPFQLGAQPAPGAQPPQAAPFPPVPPVPPTPPVALGAPMPPVVPAQPAAPMPPVPPEQPGHEEAEQPEQPEQVDSPVPEAPPLQAQPLAPNDDPQVGAESAEEHPAPSEEPPGPVAEPPAPAEQTPAPSEEVPAPAEQAPPEETVAPGAPPEHDHLPPAIIDSVPRTRPRPGTPEAHGTPGALGTDPVDGATIIPTIGPDGEPRPEGAAGPFAPPPASDPALGHAPGHAPDSAPPAAGVPEATILSSVPPAQAAARLAAAQAAAPAGGINARLRVSTGQTCHLTSPVLVGRSPDAGGIAVDGPAPQLLAVPSPNLDISRTHAEVRVEGDHVLVTDLRSTNGTVVQAPGASPRRLHAGESVAVSTGTIIDLGDGVTMTVEQDG